MHGGCVYAGADVEDAVVITLHVFTSTAHTL